MPDLPLTRRNHYISRLYLKRWADDMDRVWTYRLLVGHQNNPLWKPSSISAVGYHNNLYTRILTSGESDEIEKWLAREFEDPAEEPIRKAVSERKLSPKDWQSLIRFLAAQDVRTPARMMEMLQRMRRTMPDTIQTTLAGAVKALTKAKKEGKPLPTPIEDSDQFPSRVTVQIEPGAAHGQLKLEAVIGRGLWLSQLKRLLQHTSTVLQQHDWTILRSPKAMLWATSDDPVVRLDYYGPGNYDFGGGWGKIGTEIFLPLGPRHLLFTKIGAKTAPRNTRVSEDLGAMIQRFTFEHAHRYVFAQHQDETMPAIRPRRVDASALKSEAKQWAKWHEEQSSAERELFAGKRPPLRGT